MTALRPLTTLALALALVTVATAPTAAANPQPGCGDGSALAPPAGQADARVSTPLEGDCAGASAHHDRLDCTDKSDVGGGHVHAHVADGRGCGTGAWIR